MVFGNNYVGGAFLRNNKKGRVWPGPSEVKRPASRPALSVAMPQSCLEGEPRA